MGRDTPVTHTVFIYQALVYIIIARIASEEQGCGQYCRLPIRL